MKRIAFLSFVICCLSFSSIAAQTDTLVINEPNKVTIVSNDSLQRVIVNGRRGDSDFVYQNTIRLVDGNYESNVSISRDHWELIPSLPVGRSRKTDDDGTNRFGHRNVITSHLGIGFTAPTKADSRLDFSTFKSWEFFANIIQWDHAMDRRWRDMFSFGLGIDWRNYRITDDYPLEFEPKFSRIKVFSLTATLRYEHDFGYGFAIGFGPVVNFNTYASIKTRYKFLGEKQKRIEKNIRERPITIDWMLNMRIADFPFYVKYSNDDVLKDGGVKFRSLSFGLYL